MSKTNAVSRNTSPRRGWLAAVASLVASSLLLASAGTAWGQPTPPGTSVKWGEFPAGPQLLEGLNVGSVDLGYVGEAPPIFAQAAGAQFIYAGYDPAAPPAEAVVVPRDSSIRTVADLKGRKIALNKGSNVHYLLVPCSKGMASSTATCSPSFSHRPMPAPHSSAGPLLAAA